MSGLTFSIQIEVACHDPKIPLKKTCLCTTVVEIYHYIVRSPTSRRGEANILLLYTKDCFQEGLAVAGNTLHRVLLSAGLRALRPFLMQHTWHLMPETFSIDPSW